MDRVARPGLHQVDAQEPATDGGDRPLDRVPDLVVDLDAGTITTAVEDEDTVAAEVGSTDTSSSDEDDVSVTLDSSDQPEGIHVDV